MFRGPCHLHLHPETLLSFHNPEDLDLNVHHGNLKSVYLCLHKVHKMHNG